MKKLQVSSIHADIPEMLNKSRQNLKSTYRGIKDHSNKSGNEKKTGFFYEELDAILGHRPASTPPVILDALGGGLSADPEEDREYSDESGKSVATSIGTVTANNRVPPFAVVVICRTMLWCLNWYVGTINSTSTLRKTFLCKPCQHSRQSTSLMYLFRRRSFTCRILHTDDLDIPKRCPIVQ